MRSSGPTAHIPRAVDATPARAVDDLAERYVEEAAGLDPVLATYAGIAGHDSELTDYSPAGFEARTELDRRTLAALDGLAPVDAREQVAADALQERLGLQVERALSGTSAALNVIDSPLQHLRTVFDLMPTQTADDWTAILARVAAVGEGLAGYRETLAAQVRRGRPPARRQVVSCAGAVADWAGSDAFFPGLVARAPDLPAGLRAALDRAADGATLALAGFARFLDEELAPLARERDAAGRDDYALEARYFLGAEVDLDETYAWGFDELARIEAEMAEVAAEIVPGARGPGAVAEAVAALDAEPARRIAGAEAFRAWMQQTADTAVAALDGVHFDIPEPIRRLEACLAPTHEGGIYYTAPSEDLSRPGRMWWSVPAGQGVFSTWRDTTTVFHEGVPGHHLQVAQTVLRADLLNRWQRLLCWVSGHGEGWALYAERLMADLGFLDDPGDRLGMLDGQALRAARVAVDLGVHLEKTVPTGWGFPAGTRWTADVAWTFLRAHTRVEEAQLRFELDRYLGWPAQAISYKVGERLWLEAREEVRARHGAAFDLKAFHQAALDLGSLGLDPLRAALVRL